MEGEREEEWMGGRCPMYVRVLVLLAEPESEQ